MPRVIIDENVCKGCGLCVHICPQKVLVLDSGRITIKGYNPSMPKFKERCIGCGMCGVICPDSAITVEKE